MERYIDDYGERILVDDLEIFETIGNVIEKNIDKKIYNKKYTNETPFFKLGLFFRSLFDRFEYRIGIMHYNSYTDRYSYTKKISKNEGMLFFRIFNMNFEEKKNNTVAKKRITLNLSRKMQRKILEIFVHSVKIDEYDISMVSVDDIPFMSKKKLKPVTSAFKYIRMVHVSFESRRVYIYLDYRR